MKTREIPIACDMSIFTPEQRDQHIQVVHQLFDQKLSVHELSDGYCWQFADDPSLYSLIAEFISMEHRCCPFFHFALEVESGSTMISLKITGAEGVKEFVHAELPNWVTL